METNNPNNATNPANIKTTGQGKVVLIAGGGKVYTDIAARFVRSERDLEDIISTPYDNNLVKRILDSGHLAATEFDYFIFGIEGYSRVTETQLVRKRNASYLIKSGRAELGGKRNFSVVLPRLIQTNIGKINVNTNTIITDGGERLSDYLPDNIRNIDIFLNTENILQLIENWYERGLEAGLAEEDLRYMKPQATEFKAIIGMNAHGLLDWFNIRCCKNAQFEIRDLANKMLKICKDVSPDLFKDAGPSCRNLGYCPENSMQHRACKDKVITKKEALSVLGEYKRRKLKNS